MRTQTYLFLIVCFCIAINVSAQDTTYLWVGQTRTCDLRAVSPTNNLNPDWDVSDEFKDFIRLTKNGETCDVKIIKYFTGVADVTCSWTRVVNGIQFPRTWTWKFSCYENPVSISPTSMELLINKTGTVSYSHLYSNEYATATNAGITYSSFNKSVATVTNAGVVKAVGAGTALIYVHSNLSNDENAPCCTVTVTTPTVVLPKTMTLNIGESETITPTQSPGAGYTLTWTSSNTSVATVNSSGKVTAKKKGTARITAKVNGYNSSDYCDVTVTAIPKGISLPSHSLTMSAGQMVALTPTVTPSGAEYTLTWTSSNTSVATVNSSGEVTAKKKGSARITVKVNGTSLSDYCNITVADYQRGDVNGDGNVDIVDVTTLINLLLGGGANNNLAADMNGDGVVDISDVTALIEYILYGSSGVLKGDVDNNGKVDINDVTSLIHYVLNGVGQINRVNSDMNDDGAIDIRDVTLLIAKVLG